MHVVRNGDLWAELQQKLMKYNCMVYLKVSQSTTKGATVKHITDEQSEG